MLNKWNFQLGCAVLSAALIGSGAAAAELTPSQQAAIDRQVVNSEARVAGAERTLERGEAEIKQANTAFAQGLYEESGKHYLAAVKIFQEAEKQFAQLNPETFRSRVEFCRNQIWKCYYYRAQDAMMRADRLASTQEFDQAIALCKEAIEYYPEGAQVLQKRIALYEKRRVAANLRETAEPDKLIPEFTNQNYRIGVLMKQGQELYQAGLYEKSVRKYQEVVLMDPYNAEALHNLRAVYRAMGKGADDRQRNEHRKLVTEMEWKWAVGRWTENEEVSDNQLLEPQERVEIQKSPIQQKLESIIIPKVDFENVSISRIVKYLQDESRRNDPEKVGVNIFLRRYVSPEQIAAQAAKRAADRAAALQRQQSGDVFDSGFAGDDVFAAPADGGDIFSDGLTPEGETAEETDELKVTFFVDNKSLLQAIQNLCNTNNLKYRVERYAVIIAPEEVALDDLDTKFFPLEPSALTEVEGGGSNSEALQKFFEQSGVPFPEGARVIYDPRVSRLIATNTVENLRLIEEILENALSTTEPLVELSAKFIEVDQNDLQELGFDYMISYNPGNSPYPGESDTGSGGSSSGTGGSTSGSGGSTSGSTTTSNSGSLSTDQASHRLSMDDSLTNMNRNAGNDALLVLSGTARDGNFNYRASIFASNQLDSTDTLSSPRVTSLQNKEVFIQMVEERPFAEDYDDGEETISSPGGDNSSDYSIYTYVGPMPNFDEPDDLGITLRTTPQVDLERRTITLEDFNPLVRTFIGYTDYSTVDSDGNVEMMRKPIFDVRDIKTSLTVYDGETVVIGGVIDDQVDVLDDKIPILGDLPLIGRLFQSRYTQAKKRTLLIFLTCRLVKPDGSPFFPAEVRADGIPNFSLD